MGYTNYFCREEKMAKGKFMLSAADCKKICKAIDAPIQREYDDNQEPEFTSDSVCFNGIGDDGHETFYIDRILENLHSPVGGLYFSFCKTARKPYDLAVCCCLIVFRHYFGDKFRVSTDGNFEGGEWQSAVVACSNTLGYGIKEIEELINLQESS